MKLYWALFLAFPLAAATVPEPVYRRAFDGARRPRRGTGTIHPQPRRRTASRPRPRRAVGRPGRIQQAEGAVTGSLENVANALVVQIDDAKAEPPRDDSPESAKFIPSASFT